MLLRSLSHIGTGENVYAPGVDLLTFRLSELRNHSPDLQSFTIIFDLLLKKVTTYLGSSSHFNCSL